MRPDSSSIVPTRMMDAGRGLFAVAAAGLAVLSLVFDGYAPIWQPLPEWIPWPQAWVRGSALLILAASAGLCLGRTAASGALTIGAYLSAWTLTRAAAIVIEPGSVGSWYGVCEALTPLCAAWLLYCDAHARGQRSVAASFAGVRAVRAAQLLFGVDCIVFGLAHFAYADYTAAMVPAWLPARLPVAYLTGLGHAAAGVGIMTGVFPRLAATLEAIMMSSFGLLVWVPSLFAQPRPSWATPPQNQWSELVVTALLAASAWIVAASLPDRPARSAPR